MSSLPADVANQALDAAGFDFTIGDLAEGSKPSTILLRAYSQCLRQLLRAARWGFARQQSQMLLLADATGATPNVQTNTIRPWVYEYALPQNCCQARFVPWGPQGVSPPVPAGNIIPPNPQAPLASGLGSPFAGARLRPARWLLAFDPNFASDSWETPGISPQGRSVICTNVANAQLVFTALMLYPSNWDSQFRAALVAFLAGEVAFPLWSSKGKPEFGMKVRDEQYKIAADKIMHARVTDGNEGWTSSDWTPDWFRFRDTGGGLRGGYSQGVGSLEGDGGILYAGLDGCCGVGNTSAI